MLYETYAYEPKEAIVVRNDDDEIWKARVYNYTKRHSRKGITVCVDMDGETWEQFMPLCEDTEKYISTTNPYRPKYVPKVNDLVAYLSMDAHASSGMIDSRYIRLGMIVQVNDDKSIQVATNLYYSFEYIREGYYWHPKQAFEHLVMPD